MAELVEINMERSMIEFEQMKTLKLFTEDEIKEVIRKRETFEYSLAKQQKSLHDYLKYIKYESTLMRLVSTRQSSTGTELRLELSIAKKIRKLYTLATTRFPHEIRLWEQFIVFCTHNDGDPAEIRGIFATLMSFHSDKEECWLKFIRWERQLNEDGSRDQDIRVLISQAMRQHPQSIVLAVEMLQTLLGAERVAEKVRAEQAQVAYKVGAQNIGTLDFQLAALEVLLKHEFAGELSQLILDEMKEQHADKPMYWETIAQLALQGVLPSGKVAEEEAAGQESTPATRATSLRSRIEACARIYDAAVETLPAKAKGAMWAHYIDAMLQLSRHLHVPLMPLRRRLLGRAFKRAQLAGCLSLTHFTIYVQILYRMDVNEELIAGLFEWAVTQYPTSVQVWKMYMNHYLRGGESNDRAGIVFRQGRQKIEGDAAPLWHDYIVALKSNPSNNGDQLQKVYEELLLQTGSQFDQLKADYLGWIYVRGAEQGIEQARQAFRRMTRSTAVNYEMVAKLIELESQQPKPNLEEWQNALQRAVTLFGTQRRDVWMQLVQFQSRHGDPLEASKTSARAKQYLPDAEYLEFLSERQQWQERAMASA